MMNRWRVVFALCGIVCACHRVPVASDPQIAVVRSLFGPVISGDVIGGRADDGRERVWMLAGGDAIVAVDLHAGVASRTPIARPSHDSCWGLARLDDGSLWTLVGRDTLTQIDAGGRISRAIVLAEAHFGLYARGNRLVYQPARFGQSGRLLFAGVPGDPRPAPWSGIEARSFPGMARASVAALNMVACGATRTTEQPCWFPDDTSVALVDPQGRTRHVALPGLTRIAPAVLLASDKPSRPLRDVFVESTGRIWVLSSGTPAPRAPDGSGGWLLAEYTNGGVPVRARRLSEPVRLILNVDRSRVVLLAGSGMVAEITR